MRALIFVLLGLVAVYAAPVVEDVDEAAVLAELDSDSHLSPMEDEESTLAKRTLSDEELENRKYRQWRSSISSYISVVVRIESC